MYRRPMRMLRTSRGTSDFPRPRRSKKGLRVLCSGIGSSTKNKGRQAAHGLTPPLDGVDRQLRTADWYKSSPENLGQCDIAGIVVERITCPALISPRQVSAIGGVCSVEEPTSCFLVEMQPFSVFRTDFSLHGPGRGDTRVPIFSPIRDGLSPPGHTGLSAVGVRRNIVMRGCGHGGAIGRHIVQRRHD